VSPSRGDAEAALFVEYRATHDRALRNRLVEEHRDVGDYLVRRYARRGVPEDDLRQISLLAVIAAVERFDPSLGVSFSTFAGRTVEGELKRYLRDRTWIVRPPRRAQELHLELRRADEELTQRLGRSPTIAELSADTGAPEEQVLEALEAGQSYRSTSLDSAGPDEESLGARLGVDAPEMEVAEWRSVLEPHLQSLPPREQTILRLRFVNGLTQSEIAAQIGLSQMHVSRLLVRSLATLRERLGAVDGEPAP